jgi:hypothetical protein
MSHRNAQCDIRHAIFKYERPLVEKRRPLVIIPSLPPLWFQIHLSVHRAPLWSPTCLCAEKGTVDKEFADRRSILSPPSSISSVNADHDITFLLL